jgi:heme-degrading monooxygenase HmoA
LAHPDRAQEYIAHLRTETIPALRNIPGFIDASIHSRPLGAGIEFLVLTRWQSLDAIAGFAGADAEIAVVPGKAAALMIEYDRRARHFEVVQ